MITVAFEPSPFKFWLQKHWPPKSECHDILRTQTVHRKVLDLDEASLLPCPAWDCFCVEGGASQNRFRGCRLRFDSDLTSFQVFKGKAVSIPQCSPTYFSSNSQFSSKNEDKFCKSCGYAAKTFHASCCWLLPGLLTSCSDSRASPESQDPQLKVPQFIASAHPTIIR